MYKIQSVISSTVPLIKLDNTMPTVVIADGNLSHALAVADKIKLNKNTSIANKVHMDKLQSLHHTSVAQQTQPASVTSITSNSASNQKVHSTLVPHVTPKMKNMLS